MKKKLPQTSAGLSAVISASKFIWSSMKIIKGIKILSKLNQKDGIDCPGCAWPDPEKRSSLGEFCENGVKAIAEEATDRSIGSEFFQNHSISSLQKQSEYWLSQQGRLSQPVVKLPESDHYTEISWNKAYNMIGGHLKALDNPDKAVFYTSGRTSNEAAFLYQLMVRRLGSNNLPDCSNMCHESSGVGLQETLGIGKGSVTLEDFEKAELILIFGQNPATNHPRMLSALEKAKANGCKIVSINPLKEVGLIKFNNPQKVNGILGNGTKISDLYLQIKVNQDVVLLKAIFLKLMNLEKAGKAIFDLEFILNNTSGYQEFVADLKNYDLQELIESTGVPETEIDQLVSHIAQRKKIICCWAMGVTQHVNGVDNIREIVNLLLLKGAIGKPGAGTCPVRGHSNVQGDRTVGISDRPSKKLIDKISKNFGFNVPEKPGYNVVETIHEMHQGNVKVFMAMGGNFCAASPDTDITSKGLQNCELTVHVSTKLNRSHLFPGKTSLILPCLGRTDKITMNGIEQKLSVENSMGIVHATKGFLKRPNSQLQPEPSIIAGIASEIFPEDSIPWNELASDYDKIRDLIESTIDGFDHYNQKINSGKTFELPNGARHGKFNTDTGKANFTVNRCSEIKTDSGEFILTSIRSHDQFNTTIYGMDDRYRGIINERRVLFMNNSDIENMKLDIDKNVTVTSSYHSITRTSEKYRLVPYNIPKGCIAAYFPEINEVIPYNVYADKSYTPAYKSVKVRVTQN